MFVKFLGLATFLLTLQSSLSEYLRENLFVNRPCLNNQYKCFNNKCISRNLFCNSNDDCGDNSDELFCRSDQKCPTNFNYFQCCAPAPHSGCQMYFKRCIPTSWRCDGIQDCNDKTDELNCDITVSDDVTSINLQIASNFSRNWILNKRIADRKLQKWGTDLPRKIIALYLSNGTSFEDEIGYELTIDFLSKMALKKINDVETADIASYVNAFLTTCIDPRKFYMVDLVKELRRRLDNSNITDPFALLSLCNAGEIITAKDVQTLKDGFIAAKEKNRIDSMAMVILALSCASSQQENNAEEEDLLDFILELKKRQYRNGTIENLKTTALVMQALFASEREADEDNFDERRALQQILRSQEADGSFGNLANTYYVLPVLNGLSLVNISSKHCATVIRDEKEGLQRLKDQVGEKLNVKYSLWIGNGRLIQRSLTIKVPANTSFYATMEYASDLDINYRFEYNVRQRKPYIYSLHQLMDDPETRRFWSFNQLVNETYREVKIIYKSPADVYPKNNEHFVYWYRSEE